MKHIIGFIKSFLKRKSAPLLIAISIFTSMIIAKEFYYISGVNYLIVLLIMICAILIEKIYSKSVNKFYFRLAIILLLSYAYLRYLWYLKLNNLEKISDFCSDINVKIYYSQPIDFYYIMPLIILILGLATFIWLRLDRISKGNWFLIIQFLFLCNISYFTRDYTAYMAISVLIFVIYMCLNIYKKIRLKALEQKLILKLDIHKIIIYYTVAITLVFVSAMAMLQITGDKSAAEIRAIMRNKVLKNVEYNSGKLFDFSANGYGEETSLGGPLKLKDEVEFRVESDKPYYLKGNIKNKYTGTTWERTASNFYVSDRPSSSLLDKEVQAKLLGSSNTDDFVEPKNLTIYNETVNNSTSLFTPNNTVMVTASKKTVGSSSDNIYMLLDKNFGLKYYSASFYESITGMDDFNEFHEKNMKFDYNPNASENSNGLDIKYKEVQEGYSDYLQLSDTLTDRTKELEKKITGNSSIVEDKIYDIMQYLRKSYPYELNVSKPPESRDFIDYFLFDEKKGYCTYFASTAVMLCRLEGIPARYVEGYSMESTKDSDGLYVVKSSAAHAWCEVLVSAKYNLWARLECTPFMPKPGTNIIQKNNENISKLKSSKSENIDIRTFTNSKKAVINKVKNISISSFKILLFILIFIIAAVLLASLIYSIIKKQKNMKLVRKALNSNKISLLYYQVKRRLLCLGIDNSSSMSEHEYLDSIKDEELKGYLEEMVSIYEQEYYADKSAKIVYDKKKYYKQIEKYIRKKQNIIRYIIDKYELTDSTTLKNNNDSSRV